MAFQKDTSFKKFVEEFLNAHGTLPQHVTKTVYGMYYDDFIKGLRTVSVTSNLAKGVEGSLISTFVAGGQEAFLDVRGVNTRLDLEKLAKNPIQTLQALGKQTWNDIQQLDELAGDRRSDVLQALTRGELSTVKGNDTLNPQNWTTQTARSLGLPVVKTEDLITTTGGTAKSAIRLLGSNVIAGGNPDEDRQILEQGGDREAKYKAYRDLAGQLTGLSGYMESPRPRGLYYNASVIAHNRAVASELGINLDDVLKVEKRRGVNPATGVVGIYNSPGTLKQTYDAQIAAGFTDAKEAFNDILNNDAKLRRALGLEAATPANNAIWAGMNPQNKEFIREYLRSEFAEQGLYNAKFGTNKSAYELDYGAIATNKRGGVNAKGELKDSDLNENTLSREKTRRALEAEIHAKLNEPYILAGIATAAKAKTEKYALDQIATDPTYGLGLPAGTFTGLADPALTAVAATNPAVAARLAAVPTEVTNAGDLARERFISLTKSSKIANNLFFASTTKELLENIEKGKFIDTFILSTKFVGMLPFTDPRWGTASEYVQYIDKLNIIGTAKEVNKTFSAMTGLAFEANEKDLKGVAKMAPNAFKSEVWASWRDRDGPGAKWTQAAFKPGTQEGIFSQWGLQDVLSQSWGQNGQLFEDYGFINPAQYNPKTLLADLDGVDDFLRDLEAGATSIAGGATATTPFELLAKALDLKDIPTDNVYNLSSFRNQLAALRQPGTGGYDFLRLLSSNNHPGSFALDASNRWDFIARIVKENKVDQFLKPYAGILNRFNRAANAVHTFLYREIIWGGYAGNNFLINTAVKAMKPFQSMLQGLGFGDDILLAEAVSDWGFVKYFTNIGQKFSGLGSGAFTATSATSKFLTTFLSPTMLKSIGYLLGNFGGIVSGGVGFLLAGLSSATWKFSSQLMRGDIGGAFHALETELKEKVRTASKLVVGIILGLLSCISIPFLFVIGILGMTGPFEPSIGGGAYQDLITSKKISVEKTATLIGSTIEYKIKITNITNTPLAAAAQITPEDVKITSITDTLNYARPCGADGGGGIVDVTTDASYGNIRIPQLSDLPKDTLTPGESVDLGPFTLTGVRQGDGTYLNSVQVLVDGDDKLAEDSTSTVIGKGGCSLCPSGWPTQPFTLTQGAHTTDSHANAEALDLASSIGQDVHATHNGTVFRGEDPDGYGHYVKVVSPLGFSTIYGHLSVISVSSGQQVNARDTIGLLGTSGNSTGPHVHYEFKDTTIQCIPGHDLQMKNFNNPAYPDSYIPQNVPNIRCVGATSCNMSVGL